MSSKRRTMTTGFIIGHIERKFYSIFRYNVGIVMICILFIIQGCSDESNRYKKFIELYGQNSHYYCSDGYLMKEEFMSKDARLPQMFLINSQECRDKPNTPNFESTL